MRDDETEPTRHDLANAEQKISALKNIVGRAARELDALAEAECDEDAIERAERTAEQLRKIADQ